jgi:hypothetical protein
MSTHKITTIAALATVTSCQLVAFEAGTYFICQVVANNSASAMHQYITINEALFVELEQSQTAKTAEAGVISEFEIDYNTLGTRNAASFEVMPTTDSAPQTTQGSSAFNMAPPEPISLFAN